MEFDLSRFDRANIRRNLAGFYGGLIGAAAVWLTALGVWAAFGFDSADATFFEFVLPLGTAVGLVALATPAFLMRTRTLRMDSVGLESVSLRGRPRRVTWDDPRLLIRLFDRSTSSRGGLIKSPPFGLFCWRIRTNSEIPSGASRAILDAARSKELRVSEMGRADLGDGYYLIEAALPTPDWAKTARDSPSAP